jgi:farnesyl diphosphate synthase/geranylgeranyl diphosphate synthase type II
LNSLLADFMSQYLPQIETHLTAGLPAPIPGSEQLREAMAYSLLNGGKRLRPLLVLAAAQACGGINDATWAAVVAVEYIHTYSLIHDDLPAMDNDDLRRGKPTCHKAFNEAIAILAGDALQCAAFECLAKSPQTLVMVGPLAAAAGAGGMVAGQAIDLAAVDNQLSLMQLRHMHKHKTGALIRASVQLGAISASAVSTAAQPVGADQTLLVALTRYADAIGLAFQIQDDILDVTADTDTLGKQQGADAANNKPTYVSLLGLEQAQQQARQLYVEAIEALKIFEDSALLSALADYIVARKK